jgi:hypothetical protein
MSYMPVSGIIGNNLGEYPVAGIGMGLTPMGYGMGYGMGSPIKIDRKHGGITVTSPIGMPLATTFGTDTIVSNPFGGLSGMTGINTAMLNPYGNFSGATLGFAGIQQVPLMGTVVRGEYNDKGVNVSVTGCKADVEKVIQCLKDHLA